MILVGLDVRYKKLWDSNNKKKEKLSNNAKVSLAKYFLKGLNRF